MKRDWVITVSFGELILKGKNRQRFVNEAEKQIRKSLADLPVKGTYSELGMYFVEVDEADLDRAIRQIRKVFGIVYITPTLRVDKTEEAITEAAIFLMGRKLEEIAGRDRRASMLTFKVEGKRVDKSFPLNSLEIAREIGGNLLDHFDGDQGQEEQPASKTEEGDGSIVRLPHLKVDVHRPDCRLWVDIRDRAYVYLDRVHGLGGLPWGSGGRGLLLLSGGIDSPAAGFEMARRGLALGAVHFHAYPFTSERAQDKAIRLAKKMSEYVGPMRVYLVNLVDSYTTIQENCRPRNTTILSRRMMMRIADRICDDYHYDALITGESLGQVASQTIQGIQAVNEAADHVILRPFVATDKTDIIDIAKMIDTYEISIEPHQDCCSIFAPTQPNTKPRLHDILEEEKNLDIPALLDKAIAGVEIIDIE